MTTVVARSRKAVTHLSTSAWVQEQHEDLGVVLVVFFGLLVFLVLFCILVWFVGFWGDVFCLFVGFFGLLRVVWQCWPASTGRWPQAPIITRNKKNPPQPVLLADSVGSFLLGYPTKTMCLARESGCWRKIEWKEFSWHGLTNTWKDPATNTHRV